MNDSLPDMPRRKLVLTSAALATLGLPACDDPTQKPHNVYDALSGFTFTGQNGEKISIEGLRSKNKERFATLSFSYNGCVDYCPFINPHLATMDGGNKSLLHYVISAQPQFDGPRQKDRDVFMQTFRNMGVKNEIVILYPQSDTDIPKIANKLQLVTDRNDPKQHPAEITLYAPGGNMAGRKNAITERDYSDWAKLMNQGLKR